MFILCFFLELGRVKWGQIREADLSRVHRSRSIMPYVYICVIVGENQVARMVKGKKNRRPNLLLFFFRTFLLRPWLAIWFWKDLSFQAAKTTFWRWNLQEVSSRFLGTGYSLDVAAATWSVCCIYTYNTHIHVYLQHKLQSIYVYFIFDYLYTFWLFLIFYTTSTWCLQCSIDAPAGLEEWKDLSATNQTSKHRTWTNIQKRLPEVWKTNLMVLDVCFSNLKVHQNWQLM